MASRPLEDSCRLKSKIKVPADSVSSESTFPLCPCMAEGERVLVSFFNPVMGP